MNFKENPFGLLDASPRDTKRVLHDKAENKSFELSEDVCRNAENILITPKKRLEAELAWFPGVSPKRVKELLLQIKDNADNGALSPKTFASLDSLAYANALAVLLVSISEAEFDKGGVDKDALKEIVEEFCKATSSIDSQETLKLINEDRVASGFAEIQDDEAILQGLQNMQRLYKQTLHDFLDCFDSSLIVAVLTELIEDNTNLGEDECEYPLLDDVISDYEVEVTPFFDKQEEKISSDIDEIKTLIAQNTSPAVLSASIDRLEKDVHLWDKVAQPIQVSYKSKGLEHKRSSSLALKVRELSIAAYGKDESGALSERISKLLLEVFAEVPLVAEAITDDLEFITTTRKDKETIDAVKAIIKKYDIVPSSGDSAKSTFQKCWDEALPLIREVSDVKGGKNYLASFFLHYVVEYANAHKDYSTCLEILAKIKPLITDKELLTRFYKNEFIIKQNLESQQIRAQSRQSTLRFCAIFILITGVIGAIIGACDRHAGIVEGFLGGLGFGAILVVIGLVRSLGRW